VQRRAANINRRIAERAPEPTQLILAPARDLS